MRVDAGQSPSGPPVQARHGRNLSWPMLAVILLIYVMGGFNGLDRIIRDAQFRLAQHTVDSDIVLIDIDAKSLRQLDTWPWPRSYHARVLNMLSNADPAQIVFDIDFSSKTTAFEDAAFADALRAWPKDRVILPAFLQYTDAEQHHVTANYPIPELRRHARLGSINLYPSSDGLVRSVSLRSEDHPPNTDALSYLLQERPGNLPELIYLNLAIEPDSFRHISYVDILNGHFDPASIVDRKIIIGATAIELRDQISVPLHRTLPGPIVQALAYESLRDPLRRVSLIGNVALTALIGITLIFHSRRHTGAQPRTWSTAGSILLIFCASTIAHLWVGILFDSAALMTFTIMSYLIGLLAHIDSQSLQTLTQNILLRRNQKLLSTIHNNSQEGIIHVDMDGVITSINPAVLSMFGYTPETIKGTSLQMLLPDIKISRSTESGPLSAASKRRRSEVIAKRHDGSRFAADVAMDHAVDSDLVTTTVFIRDISKQKEQQDLLDYQVTHDILTGLYNKCSITSAIDEDLSTSSDEQPATLLIIGLDSMKDINLTLGHVAGDSLLKMVADRLTDATRKHARMIARLDGEEFAIWSLNTMDHNLALADTIKRIFESPIQLGGIQIEIGACIGIAGFPQHGTSATDLLKNAGTALRTARSGANGVAVFAQDNDQRSIRRLTLTSQLRSAIEQNQLMLYFQPKLDLRSGKITSAEALLRWKHAELGFISPTEFIDAAENSGLIKPLTDWCIRTALKQHILWREQGIDVRIAVNVSTKLLQEKTLITLLNQLSLQHPGITEALTLEITESAVMTDTAQALDLLRKLSDEGYRISLDDFGTGHSSFAYLKDLPVHELKIDKCFVLNMHENPKDRRIVTSIIELAHSLGLDVVAEGVESEAIQAALKQNGCEYGQGFGIAKPMPAHELTTWLYEAERACVCSTR